MVVLDVMLPGKDGFTVMSEMRQAGHFVPTLMLTARGHPEDVLKGFAAGADDYLTKPFELAILIARIRGLLRRKDWLRAVGPRTLYVFGNKSVDFNRGELRVGEQVFPLTLMEANVLRYLTQHEGQHVRARRCSRRCGACMKTPTLAPSTISSCGCGAISKTIPRVRAIC